MKKVDETSFESGFVLPLPFWVSFAQTNEVLDEATRKCGLRSEVKATVLRSAAVNYFENKMYFERCDIKYTSSEDVAVHCCRSLIDLS